jgi:hypothetical protein
MKRIAAQDKGGAAAQESKKVNEAMSKLASVSSVRQGRLTGDDAILLHTTLIKTWGDNGGHARIAIRTRRNEIERRREGMEAARRGIEERGRRRSESTSCVKLSLIVFVSSRPDPTLSRLDPFGVIFAHQTIT